MKLREAVRQFLLQQELLAGCDRVICALSGGADSVCMTHVLLSLAPELGFRVECAHFDHMLRGAESRRDAAFAAEWCWERGIPFHPGQGDVGAYAAERHLGMEEAARELRYAFLDTLGDARTRIATAHHADDQAETVLLALLRGSGLRGLAGIPPVRGRYIRPLLSVTRAEILQYLEEESLAHVEDSSNALDAGSRNRLRHQVLPVLREMNPGFSRRCTELGLLLRREDAYLERQAAPLAGSCEGGALSVSALLEADPVLVARALRQAAAVQGISLTRRQVWALEALLRSPPSARLSLPGGLRARRDYDCLYLGRQEASAEPMVEAELPFGHWVPLSGRNAEAYYGGVTELGKIQSNLTTFFFKKEKICGTICVRPRKPGDTLCLPGRRGTKSLKKWMIELHIPARQRDRLPVLADGEGVLAVPGIGAAARACAPAAEADAVIILKERTEDNGNSVLV